MRHRIRLQLWESRREPVAASPANDLRWQNDGGAPASAASDRFRSAGPWDVTQSPALGVAAHPVGFRTARQWCGVFLWLLMTTLSLPVTQAGEYRDLGRPVIGAWQRFSWIVHDPVLKRDILWSQECSQDGAVLYALELNTGKVIEEHDVPAREVGGLQQAADGVLYLHTYSGLNHPGNELLRFDPRRRKIERLGLADTPHNRCIDGTIGPDGNVYISTHQQGRLFRFETTTEKWSDLGQMVPPPIRPRQNVWLRNLQFLPSGKLLAAVTRSPPAEVVEIDVQTAGFRQIDAIHSSKFIVHGDRILNPIADGFDIYDLSYRKVAHVTSASLELVTAANIASRLTLVAAHKRTGVLALFGRALLQIDLKSMSSEKLAELPFAGEVRISPLGDRVVVIHHPLRKFAVIDVESRKMTINTIGYRGKRGTQICGLHRSSDGSIYGTNIIGMHVFRVDQRNDALRDLGHVGWSGGEVYNTIKVNGQVYLGTYGGGRWGVYDPQRAWKPDFAQAGQSAAANPRRIGPLGGQTPDAANRPFEYAEGPDGKIYIACRANYGHPGGALVQFDPQTRAFQVFRDQQRSLQTVSADDRFVFAGTNIRGGRGSGERADAATLIVFDPDTGQRVFERSVVAGAKAVVCIRFNPHDKYVYATTDNQVLLRFHPRKFTVEKTWRIRSAGTPLAGVPEDVGMLHITAAGDGNIYGVAYRELYRLRVDQDRLEYLETPPRSGLYQIVEGRPGNFYIGAGTHLLKYSIDPQAYYR